MASRFKKGAPASRVPTPLEQIGPEISHLKGKGSVRHLDEVRRSKASWGATLVFAGLFALYFMDPVLHALYKYEAIRTYLYLHNFDSTNATDALVATHILRVNEITALSQRQGSFQDYFSSQKKGEARAAAIVSYMNGVQDLHMGNYERLGLIGKLRYVLFVRTHLSPPTEWSAFDPSAI